MCVVSFCLIESLMPLSKTEPLGAVKACKHDLKGVNNFQNQIRVVFCWFLVPSKEATIWIPYGIGNACSVSFQK